MNRLDIYKKQAKQLVRWHREGNYSIGGRIRGLARYKTLTDREALALEFSLREAQEIIALEAGYASWLALKVAVTDEPTPAKPMPPMPRLTRAVPVICVVNVQASAEFFRNTLGFSIDFLHGHPAFYGSVSRDGACVHLKFVHEPVLAVGAQDRDGFITAFIEVENVKALYAEYVTAGATFDQKLKKQAWGDATSSSGTLTATASPLSSQRSDTYGSGHGLDGRQPTLHNSLCNILPGQPSDTSMIRHTLDTLHSTTRDLAHAARSLAKDRGFTLICVISLGIGMGALVALATFTRAITAPARVVNTDGLTELLVLPLGPLRAKAGVWAVEQWSYPDYQALRDSDTGMAVTGWVMESSQFGTATPDNKPLPRVATLYASANYFRTFGVSLARGQEFDPAIDDAASAEPRVVLSHSFWKSRLAADPEIVGKSVTIDGVAHTVIGIAPADFHGHFHFFQAPESLVFLPLERHPRLRANPTLRDDRTVDWVRIHGRLAPGETISRANAKVLATITDVARRYPASNEFKAATVEPYSSLGAAGRPESRRVTSILLGLAGAVLLIVCLNISGMMLVRGANRERELSIRAGARREPAASHPAPVLRGVAAGGCRRGAERLRALRYSRHGCVVVGRAGSSGGRSGRGRHRDLVRSVPARERALRPVAGASLQPSQSDCRAEGGCRWWGRHAIRVHRVAAMVQIGIAIPFFVLSGVMLDRVRTAEFGFPTDGLAAAASAGVSRTGARGRFLDPEGSRQSSTGQRRPLRRGGRGHADRLRLPELSRRQSDCSEVRHGAGHARRREFPRDHRRAAGARPDDHGR